MSQRFTGKVALIAGGTGGLGRSVSTAFLDEGAKVVVTYRDQKELDDLTASVGPKSSALQAHQVDVTNATAVDQFVEKLLAEHRHLDIVVNTVGGYAGGTSLWQTDPAAFDRMLSLNLLSGYLLAHAVLPAMLKQKEGSIINIASKAAVDHAAGAAAYAASKAAAVAMMDSLAADLNGTGVRVNSILPSIIDTAANRKMMSTADFAKWPKPDDIAKVILFLCSEDAKVIHGAAVPVYGNS